ncbi:hypothetical protein BBAD15_g476 [Beauveria bassiana D1-5]|uniref:Uncharacterized protein n=1 Tax=Beauveria bassiana D1-5 TaxID=1245745 RepID=A0A0A2W0H4_BEABA|nr:hypothetical protein BBAD15_g476 [Beauveria bassiana D1-5]
MEVLEALVLGTVANIGGIKLAGRVTAQNKRVVTGRSLHGALDVITRPELQGVCPAGEHNSLRAVLPVEIHPSGDCPAVDDGHIAAADPDPAGTNISHPVNSTCCTRLSTVTAGNRTGINNAAATGGNADPGAAGPASIPAAAASTVTRPAEDIAIIYDLAARANQHAAPAFTAAAAVAGIPPAAAPGSPQAAGDAGASVVGQRAVAFDGQAVPAFCAGAAVGRGAVTVSPRAAITPHKRAVVRPIPGSDNRDRITTSPAYAATAGRIIPAFTTGHDAAGLINHVPAAIDFNPGAAGTGIAALRVTDAAATFKLDPAPTFTAVAAVPAGQVIPATVGVPAAAGTGIAADDMAAAVIDDLAAALYGDPAPAITARRTITHNAGALARLNRPAVTAVAAVAAQNAAAVGYRTGAAQPDPAPAVSRLTATAPHAGHIFVVFGIGVSRQAASRAMPTGNRPGVSHTPALGQHDTVPSRTACPATAAVEGFARFGLIVRRGAPGVSPVASIAPGDRAAIGVAARPGDQHPGTAVSAVATIPPVTRLGNICGIAAAVASPAAVTAFNIAAIVTAAAVQNFPGRTPAAAAASGTVAGSGGTIRLVTLPTGCGACGQRIGYAVNATCAPILTLAAALPAIPGPAITAVAADTGCSVHCTAPAALSAVRSGSRATGLAIGGKC